MRVAVIGGGVIGLAAAWHLAGDGHAVSVLDGAPGAREASWAAAGMLAPHHEAAACDDLWRFGAHSLARWGELAQALGAEAIDYRLGGGLVPLIDEPARSRGEARAAMLEAAGVAVRLYDGPALARIEPALAATVPAALHLPGGQVDPRRLLAALHGACGARGVALRYGEAVASVEDGAVALQGGGALACDLAVVASGAWTPALVRATGLALAGEPVKGQMIRLEVRDGLLGRFVHAHEAYLVPRAGVGMVVGSTMVETGFAKDEDAAAIARLADGARALVPALARAPIRETWTGLRPRLAGGRRLVARRRARLVVATGHLRNGILLCAATADAIADLAAGREVHPDVRPFTVGSA